MKLTPKGFILIWYTPMSRLMFSINPPSTSLELTLLNSAYLEKYFFVCLFIYWVWAWMYVCMYREPRGQPLQLFLKSHPPIGLYLSEWYAGWPVSSRYLLVSAFPALWLQTSMSYFFFLTQVLGDEIRVLWFTKQILYWLSYYPNSGFFKKYLFIYLLACLLIYLDRVSFSPAWLRMCHTAEKDSNLPLHPKCWDYRYVYHHT